jgi:uncharacterized protein (DUF433 family)
MEAVKALPKVVYDYTEVVTFANGVPVIAGTQMPLYRLVEYLVGEDTNGLAAFLRDHPHISYQQADGAIEWLIDSLDRPLVVETKEEAAEYRTIDIFCCSEEEAPAVLAQLLLYGMDDSSELVSFDKGIPTIRDSRVYVYLVVSHLAYAESGLKAFLRSYPWIDRQRVLDAMQWVMDQLERPHEAGK